MHYQLVWRLNLAKKENKTGSLLVICGQSELQVSSRLVLSSQTEQNVTGRQGKKLTFY